MPEAISGITLDELLRELIAGETVLLADGSAFGLESKDSRALLAFYRDNRDYWNPRKNIVDREINELLAAIDAEPLAGPIRPRKIDQKKYWRLTKIEAHRFGGLHRHCGDLGEDPDLFSLDLHPTLTLVRGFNGAGKTSLLSAISWALTGYAYRSQALPSEVHLPLTLTIDQGSSEGANEDEEPELKTYELPPVVPFPSDTELQARDEEPACDTWVRLSFTYTEGDEPVVIKRRLERRSNGKIETIVEGLEQLGVPELGLQVGTTMPGIAAAMRFDEATTLSKAISTLTGLKPMELLGKRCRRLHSVLTGREVERTSDKQTECMAEFNRRLALYKQGTGLHSELPDAKSIVAPSSHSSPSSKESILSALEKISQAEAKIREDAEKIIGETPDTGTPQSHKTFLAFVENADRALSSDALSALPSLSKAIVLGKITREEIGKASDLVDEIVSQAKAHADLLEDKEKASRWQLYTAVAQWHQSQHPDAKIDTCPICQTSLRDPTQKLAVPRDAILDIEVAEALEQCRQADDDAAKSAANWARDKARYLSSALPSRIRQFLDEDLPPDPTNLYRQAFVAELFGKSEFSGQLKNLKANATVLFSRLSENLPKSEAVSPIQLPPVFPHEEKLESNLSRVQNAISFARYRKEHADALSTLAKNFFGDFSVPADSKDESEGTAANLPLRQQLAVLKRYADTVEPFVTARNHLNDLLTQDKIWRGLASRQSKLDRTAKAVKPFIEFPSLVSDQASGLLKKLEVRTAFWANEIYRPEFSDAPEFAGVHSNQNEVLTILAAKGTVQFPAHQAMNASALRVFLWAFIFALWEQLAKESTSLSTLLMDDPQLLLDPPNSANLAAIIPDLVGSGITPLVASNDDSFLHGVEFYTRKKIRSHGRDLDLIEISPVSRARLTAATSPVLDEILSRLDQWQSEDPNSPSLARAFVEPVRIRIEVKLWDLLAEDPTPLHDPTLSDLLGRIANCRNTGQRPFNERPFEALLSLPELQATHNFRRIINKAHHKDAHQITPMDAEEIAGEFKAVLSSIDACLTAYARFMRRLPIDLRMVEEEVFPDPPAPFPLSVTPLPILGKLAARESVTTLVEAEHATETFTLESIAPVALFTLRSSTLGLAALQGQNLIVNLGEEAKHGDFVVAIHGSKVFARRLALDPSDSARIALESTPTISANVAPTRFLPRFETRLLKVKGVLFDNADAVGPGEARLVSRSDALVKATALAEIVGDSAFPLARDGDKVLLSRETSVDALTGRIVAVYTRAKEDSSGQLHGYLKRLGKPMPGQDDIRYLENIGLVGEGEYVQFPHHAEPKINTVEVVEAIFRVRGVIYA